MDITQIEKCIEKIASHVHDAWWAEKKKQGFHPPYECKTIEAGNAHKQDIKSYGHNEFPLFHKFCGKCHTDMYPYEQLPENVKEYDRITVKAVIEAIKKI